MNLNAKFRLNRFFPWCGLCVVAIATASILVSCGRNANLFGQPPSKYADQLEQGKIPLKPADIPQSIQAFSYIKRLAFHDTISSCNPTVSLARALPSGASVLLDNLTVKIESKNIPQDPINGFTWEQGAQIVFHGTSINAGSQVEVDFDYEMP